MKFLWGKKDELIENWMSEIAFRLHKCGHLQCLYIANNDGKNSSHAIFKYLHKPQVMLYSSFYGFASNCTYLIESLQWSNKEIKLREECKNWIILTPNPMNLNIALLNIRWFRFEFDHIMFKCSMQLRSIGHVTHRII